MKEKSVAIVGSRSASELSLLFTDRVAKLSIKEFKVVVSGFAKGVDKQALDSAVRYKAQSIIVLPQGIMTFGTGYKTYYKQIVEGDLLVLSVFHPKAPWRPELAMARNPIIYGLANEIYVPESSDKGGTWSGVVDGIRKNRTIYVRKAEARENTANDLLIRKGAIPVDFDGVPLQGYTLVDKEQFLFEETKLRLMVENNIVELLKTGEFTAKEMLMKLQLDWKEKKLRDFLATRQDVESLHVRPIRFILKNKKVVQQSLF